MWEKIIAYFAKRHLVTNFIVLAVFVGGVFSWFNTSKEELPDITFDFVRVSVRYPGAPAEDVEYFVTKPIEEVVRGLDGVFRVTSTSSVGSTSISIEIEQDYPNLEEAVTEIRNAVLDVQLPEDVIDDPNIRLFKTSKKAIIDIALIYRGAQLLDFTTREELQQYAFALENQLLNLSEVNTVNKRGYLQEEIQITAYPQRLQKYNIPFNAIKKQIQDNHVRQPAGSIETEKEPKVTILSELNTIEKLNSVIVQGGFEGQVVRLAEVADVKRAYEKNKNVIKINGHEGIMFSVVKNSSYGIIEALDAVTRVTESFKKNNLEGTPIELSLLDDESVDIRNRLSLISINGAIGFVLILGTLFLFLNIRSGIWVAIGIPFTICFTLLAAHLIGYTINGITLAAVIIVMGMIVDDAIVVAENITRMLQQGVEDFTAIVKGTAYVTMPIIASILTTCIAFIPLFFFHGRFGKFIEFIPTIIFLMLGASLFESIFILPGHMHLRMPSLFDRSSLKGSQKPKKPKGHWFERVEGWYGAILKRVLPFKLVIFTVFIGLLLFSGYILQTKMKFVMFPNEETRDLVLSGETPQGSTRYETARMTEQIEAIIDKYLGKEVVGYRTDIARSRRGGAVTENSFRMIIEIVPKEKRKKSADQLVNEIKSEMELLPGFKKLKFQKSRWGQSSGSAIELLVQQNNDEVRAKIVQELMLAIENHPEVVNPEVDGDFRIPEYRIDIVRDKIKRLSINPGDIASTFRSALEGSILYDFSNGDEDIQVRFTTIDDAKNDIEKVLDLPVENKGNYLVPLRDIVTVEQLMVPNSIERRDSKRTTIIDASMKPKTKATPIEIAEFFEENIFPKILTRYPTTSLSFGGEVQDTRESKSDIKSAVVMTLLLIFFILAILFDSLTKPLIIMLAIPFGVVGVIIAFWLHGKTLFGFYAAIGALGLAGVVINDSIIMLVKLDKEFDRSLGRETFDQQIANISQTRLRAVMLTTLTTVAGLIPTAYGFAGFDAMLAEMMLALTWGLIFGTTITLILIPCVYSLGKNIKYRMRAMFRS